MKNLHVDLTRSTLRVGHHHASRRQGHQAEEEHGSQQSQREDEQLRPVPWLAFARQSVPATICTDTNVEEQVQKVIK